MYAATMAQLSGCTRRPSAGVAELQEPQEHQRDDLHREHAHERAPEPRRVARDDLVRRRLLRGPGRGHGAATWGRGRTGATAPAFRTNTAVSGYVSRRGRSTGVASQLR